MRDHLTLKNLHFFALCVLVASLPLSKFTMSVAQFLLALHWFLEGNCIKRTLAFFKNKYALVFISIYLLHIIGMAYTSDWSYGINDLRVKLPWLVIPFMLATGPALSLKKLNQLMYLFVAAVVVSTLTGAYFYLFTEYTDIRNISRFVSHIRLSLFIDLSLVIMFSLYINRQHLWWHRLVAIIVALWLLFFLFLLQAITGIMVFFVLLLVLMMRYIVYQKEWYPALRIGIFSLMLILPLAVTYYLYTEYKQLSEPRQPLSEIKKITHTALGNPYQSQDSYFETENGYYIGFYICGKELEESWNKRSKIDYSKGFDLKGNHLKETLMRFLTSKGLRKDAAGVEALSDKEILAIERGVPNYLFLHPFSLKAKLAEFVWGWKAYKRGDPNGNTLFQRVEYWKASLKIIDKAPLFGLGTGDNALAFKRYYETTPTNLLPAYQLRSHNQFMAIAISLGLVGLLVFLISVFYPVIKSGLLKELVFFSFMLIITLSMLTDDTLETQAGITFFIIFYSLYIFAHKYSCRIRNEV